MRKIPASVVLFLLFLLVAAEAVLAFRCGTRLVSIGDRTSEVADKCGSPTWVDAWEEDRIERVYGTPYSNGSYLLGTRVPVAAVVRVPIEEWTYNLGPNQFIRILRFENNRLIDIQTGSYGY